jgi:hypothetical protein
VRAPRWARRGGEGAGRDAGARPRGGGGAAAVREESTSASHTTLHVYHIPSKAEAAVRPRRALRAYLATAAAGRPRMLRCEELAGCPSTGGAACSRPNRLTARDGPRSLAEQSTKKLKRQLDQARRAWASPASHTIAPSDGCALTLRSSAGRGARVRRGRARCSAPPPPRTLRCGWSFLQLEYYQP